VASSAAAVTGLWADLDLDAFRARLAAIE
jgi:hypothetical protein